MDAPRDDLVRAYRSGLEFRDDASTDGTLGTLEGHFTVFNEWTEVHDWYDGTFMERIAPGAAKKTIRDNRDNVKVLYDHGHDPQLGNKVLGNIDDLREDKVGVFYSVPLFDTSYNRDLLPGLKAGAYGASFRFRVTREEWVDAPGTSAHNEKGLPERTIKEFSLAEFGPVTFPAYPSATATARALTGNHIEWLYRDDPELLNALRKRASDLRTLASDDAGSATSSDTSAAPPTPDAGRDHLGTTNQFQALDRVRPFRKVPS